MEPRIAREPDQIADGIDSWISMHSVRQSIRGDQFCCRFTMAICTYGHHDGCQFRNRPAPHVKSTMVCAKD